MVIGGYTYRLLLSILYDFMDSTYVRWQDESHRPMEIRHVGIRPWPCPKYMHVAQSRPKAPLGLLYRILGDFLRAERVRWNGNHRYRGIESGSRPQRSERSLRRVSESRWVAPQMRMPNGSDIKPGRESVLVCGFYEDETVRRLCSRFQIRIQIQHTRKAGRLWSG